jgi:nucleoside phosphorylase
MTETPICLVTALPAEAKPLNGHYGLIRDNNVNHTPLYRNGNMTLVVSGVGKKAAYDATSRLAQMLGAVQVVWVNLGIAGHPSRAIGEAVLASEILDGDDNGTWRATIPFEPPCATDRLTTLSGPDMGYRRPTLCDMEAAGFYAAALQYAPPDRIYCLKVISDNLLQPAVGINAKMVSRLIKGRLSLLDWLLLQLRVRNEH